MTDADWTTARTECPSPSRPYLCAVKMRDAVDWAVTNDGLVTKFWYVLASAFNFVWGLVFGSSDDLRSELRGRGLPGDPLTEFSSPNPPTIQGSAPWLSNRYTDRHFIALFSGEATADPLNRDRPVTLPLASMRIESARKTGRMWKHKQARAEWELRLKDDADTYVIRGEWLDLAWLGHLGGWPEPT